MLILAELHKILALLLQTGLRTFMVINNPAYTSPGLVSGVGPYLISEFR